MFSFNFLIYCIVFLVGALNYALMLGTLELITGGFPLFPSLDLLRTEGSFFLFIGFACACYLIASPVLLWTRRIITLVLVSMLLYLAHLAAVLAQITAEAGPLHKILFYSNYLHINWINDHSLELFLLYGVPAFVLCNLFLIYFFCLNSETDGPYLKQKFRKYFFLAFAFLLSGFVNPLQSEIPYSLSHNALLYVLKTGYSPQKDIYQHDSSAQYAEWKFVKNEHVEVSQRNFVLILLESLRKDSIVVDETHLNEISPFMSELAQKSTVYAQAYGTVPHTSKALVGIHCGILPILDLPIFESIYGLPVKCLPEMMGELGYNTAFFQGASRKYENRKELLSVFGYQHQITAEDFVGNKALERVNPLGVDEFSVLEKSLEWVDQKDRQPFLLSYLTLATHHPYDLSHFIEQENFHEQASVNKYLNGVKYTDQFVEALFKSFKQRGLYTDTVFIFVSDHGEAFGEHGEQVHNNVAYNEVAQLFLMIHDPMNQTKLISEETVSQLQIMPTVFDFMGYKQEEEKLPVSMAHSQGEAFGSCYERLMCFFYVNDQYKYIYNFNEKKPELYNVRLDPKELNDLSELEPELMNSMHERLMQKYDFHQSAMHNYYSAQNPDYLDEVAKTVLYSISDMRNSLFELFPEEER